MRNRYIIDSVGFINYFYDFFKVEDKLSKKTRLIIDNCIKNLNEDYLLVVPSIVIIEVYFKFLFNDEMINNFRFGIYDKIKYNSQIELKPIEKDVIEILSSLNDFELEHHDKIIYASAIELESILISKDSKIISYNNYKSLIPDVIF